MFGVICSCKLLRRDNERETLVAVYAASENFTRGNLLVSHIKECESVTITNTITSIATTATVMTDIQISSTLLSHHSHKALTFACEHLQTLIF